MEKIDIHHRFAGCPRRLDRVRRNDEALARDDPRDFLVEGIGPDWDEQWAVEGSRS